MFNERICFNGRIYSKLNLIAEWIFASTFVLPALPVVMLQKGWWAIKTWWMV